MSAMVSQITSLTIVYSTVYSGADQRRHQSSASLAFVRGIHRWPVNSPHKGPVTRKMFPFDDVIVISNIGKPRPSITSIPVAQSFWHMAWSTSHTEKNKPNLRDLIAATGLVILLKLDSNRRFVSPCDLEIWWMTSKKLYGTSFRLHQALCIILNTSVNSNWSYCPETLSPGQNRRFIGPCDFEIWRMTLKNNRAPLLCCFKLYASFHSRWWIQNGVTVRKRPIWVKFDAF